MSYKQFCDRCGKEMEKGKYDNELHFTKERKTRWGYDKLMHLCDNCLKDFDKFMEKK